MPVRKIHYIVNENVDWETLSSNPNAISFLKQNLDQFGCLSSVCWWGLSINPKAISILEQNPDRVKWDQLSSNPNINAISLLETKLDEVEWNRYHLSTWLSINAISILEKNVDKLRQKDILLNQHLKI